MGLIFTTKQFKLFKMKMTFLCPRCHIRRNRFIFQNVNGVWHLIFCGSCGKKDAIKGKDNRGKKEISK